MSLTTPSVHVPDTRVSVPSWVRRHLSWMLVGLAVLATVAVLTVTLVGSDSGTATITPPFDADRGSIRAVEHRSSVGATAGASVGASTGAPSIVDQGSIVAIERRTANQGG